MDSLTQIVLGAGVGEALLGKKVGNKAILWGGIIATVPDLDIIPAIWMDDIQSLTFHRGFSHSIFFALLASPAFAGLLRKLYRKNNEATFREWTVFSFWILLTHALLDCFTSWGTQLFWPHPYRVAFNTIFIVDPLYTVPFLITIIWLMFYHRQSKTRHRLAYAGLLISSAYLAITVINKTLVNRVFEDAMHNQQIEFTRYSTKPTPFNNILWYVTAEAENGYYLGYYSFLDRDKNVDFTFIDKQHHLLKAVPENEKLSTLLYLTNGYYSMEQAEGKLLLHDLRFGQAIDPETRKGKFIFSFFLEKGSDAGELSIRQKPRNTDDIKKETFSMLWKRMLGMKEIF